MSEVFFTSDLHLSHKKVTKFEECRSVFDSIEAHDQTIMDNWNSVVTKRDLVWVLGDAAWTVEALSKFDALNGKKKLVLGNHDTFHAAEYLKYFEDVYGVVKWKKGIVFTHVPIHPEQFYRWSFNFHGHLHSENVMTWEPYIKPDERYVNVCLEQNGLFPFAWENIKKWIRYDEIRPREYVK
jgi:calcineurin-like phosphoesterase family protein